MPALDPGQLLDLAHSRTPADREALAETIMDLFDGTVSLTDRERALMFDILHKVILDVEQAVRRAVSARLAEMEDAPRDLIKQLANDVVDVAYPVLTRSRVLWDEDLIEVIRFRTLEHQLAVAMRYAVSEPVTASLAQTGNDSVIETLLRNPNARISQSLLDYLAEQSRRVDTFREPLLQRRELGRDLAKRMFLWVSAALRRHIIERFGLDEAMVEELLQQAAQDQIGESEAEQPGGSEALAAEMADAGLLEPEVMVQALAQGEIDLFVGMFACAANLRRRIVMRLLFEPEGTGFAVASKGIGLDRSTFSQLLRLSRVTVARRGGTAGATEQALDVFDTITRDQAQKVLQRWRLDPEFTAAIRAVEQDGVHG